MLSHLRSRWSRADTVERLCWLYVAATPLHLVPPWMLRVQVSDAVFAAAAAGFVWSVLRDGHRVELPEAPFRWGLGFYLLVSALSVVNSPLPGRSLLELAVIVYLVCVYLLLLNVIRTREQLWAILEVWLMALGIVVLVGLAGVVLGASGMNTRISHAPTSTYYLPFGLPRTFSTMGTAKLLSTYLVLGLVLIMARLRTEANRRARAFLLALLVGAGVVLIFTFSREWLSAGVALLVLWYCFESTTRLRGLRKAAVAAVVMLFLGIQAISTFRFLDATSESQRLVGRPVAAYVVDAYDPDEGVRRWQLAVDYIWTDYLTLKWVTWTMWREHPWLGAGVGTFPAYLKRRIAEGTVYREIADYGVPHSTIFGKAAETGLLGLGAVCGLFGAWISRSVVAVRMAQGADRWLVGAFLAGVVGLLANSPNIDLMNFRYLWLAFGLGSSAAMIGRGTPG